MAELGAVNWALLGIAGDGPPDRRLAQRICQAYLDGLDIDGVSISLLTASRSRQTLWATDSTAELLEDLQFTLGEGACIQAATTGQAVLVSDLHRSTQTAHWPIFAAAVAAQTRVAALFALPLMWSGTNLGVVELYRHAPGELSDDHRRDALSATTTTAALILLTHRLTTADGADPADDGWLAHMAEHRAEIHRATGVVGAQLGLSTGDALARLRGHAYLHDLPLAEVARDVIAYRLVFTDKEN